MGLSDFIVAPEIDGFGCVRIGNRDATEGLVAVNIRLEKGSLPLVVLEYNGRVGEIVGEGIVHIVSGDVFPERADEVEDMVLRKMDELGCQMGEAILAIRRDGGAARSE